MREFWIKVDIPEFIYWIAVRMGLIYRRIRYGYSFRKIRLTQGKFAMVDEGDYEWLNQYKWCTAKNGFTNYAIRGGKGPNQGGKHRTIKMHRQITEAPADKFVDHINHNGLDNRRANLRIVTREQNGWNIQKRSSVCSSHYKGVSLNKKRGFWRAHIAYKGKQIYIGIFDNEDSAAKAYDEKAKELFGEYANLNFAIKK
jgi:hypothetical protein